MPEARTARMSEQKNDRWIEGVVRAKSYAHGAEGKQFLGAAIECPDGTAWIIDYSELSPFHALADHYVMASGELYVPTGQRLIGWRADQVTCYGTSACPQCDLLS